jgi:succinate dehydrogenase/fumarate reductase flavoprotein subunit
VLVVEKGAQVGGTYAYGTGLAWVPGNRHAPESGEDAAAYVRSGSAGRLDEAHLTAFLRSAPGAFAYLEEEAGVPFELVPDYPDFSADGKAGGRYLSSPVLEMRTRLPAAWRPLLATSLQYRDLPAAWAEIQAWGGFGSLGRWDRQLLDERARGECRGFGSATAGYLLAAALDRGIAIAVGTAADALVREGERVAGIRLADESVVSARLGVLLATGGYDANDVLKRRLGSEPDTVPLGAPTIDGSGLVMAWEVGAAFAALGGQMTSPVYRVPGEAGCRPLVREAALPGGIIVNRAGRRFCDEAFTAGVPAAMAAYDPSSGSHPNFPAFFVFDGAWKSKYPLGSVAPGEAPPWLPRADTLDGLADLAATVDRFNRAAGEGHDPDFGRGSTAYDRNLGDPEAVPNPCLRPLEPPFYALELRLGSAGTNSGLVTTEHGQVVDVRGRPIAGLYAAGNTAANLVGGLFYNSGLANARGITFAYLGARHATGH